MCAGVTTSTGRISRRPLATRQRSCPMRSQTARPWTRCPTAFMLPSSVQATGGLPRKRGMSSRGVRIRSAISRAGTVPARRDAGSSIRDRSIRSRHRIVRPVVIRRRTSPSLTQRHLNRMPPSGLRRMASLVYDGKSGLNPNGDRPREIREPQTLTRQFQYSE